MAAALALLGVAFYVLLLPWHLTSQLVQQLYEAEFGQGSAVICGNALDAASNPALPGAPTTNCPICKGLAAFHLAVTPVLPAMLPPQFRSTPADRIAADHVASATPPTPRSRGPPLPA
jgi:Protein of unknown function (DUF2946)